MRTIGVVLACLFSISWGAILFGSPSPSESNSSYWQDVEAEIIIIGVGYDVASIGGHAALRIVDHNTGDDYSINWGLFDFNEPWFLQRFLAGELVYSVGKIPTSLMLDNYRKSEPERSIVSYPINLTPLQLQRLVAKIHWWLAPENHTYSYHMWQKNCVTLLRDSLNHAVDDNLRLKLATKPSKSVRDLASSYLFPNQPLVALMRLSFNHEVDRPLTVWEQMFLPRAFIDSLIDLKAIDDEGLSTQSPLLGEPIILYSGQRLRDPTNYFGIFGFVVVIVLALLAGYLLPTTTLMLTAIICGLKGCLLIVLWMASNLPGTGFNFNLLLFWPTDLMIAFCLIKNRASIHLLRAYVSARVSIYLMTVLGYIAGYIPQEISLVPAAVMMLALVAYLVSTTSQDRDLIVLRDPV